MNPATKAYQNLAGDMNILQGAEGNLNLEQVDPATALQYVQKLGQNVGSARQDLQSQIARSINGVPDPELQTNLKMAQDVYNSAKGLLYNRPEVQTALDAVRSEVGGQVTPDMIAATIPGIDANSPLAAKIAGDVNNASSMQDLLTQESKFVRMNQLANDAVQHNAEAVATPATVRQAKAGTDISSAPNTQMMRAAQSIGAPGGVLNKIGSVLSTAATGGNPGVDSMVGKAATALTAGGAGGVPNILPQILTHIPNYAATPDTSNITSGVPTMSSPYQTTGIDTSNLGRQMLMASMFAPNMLPELENARQSAAASNILQELETAYGNAGGAQGSFGGLLSTISGFIPGTPAYQYNQAKSALSSQAAQALGGKYSPAAIQAMLPSLMTNNATGAANQFGALQEALNTGAAGAGMALPSASVLAAL